MLSKNVLVRLWKIPLGKGIIEIKLGLRCQSYPRNKNSNFYGLRCSYNYFKRTLVEFIFSAVVNYLYKKIYYLWVTAWKLSVLSGKVCISAIDIVSAFHVSKSQHYCLCWLLCNYTFLFSSFRRTTLLTGVRLQTVLHSVYRPKVNFTWNSNLP